MNTYVWIAAQTICSYQCCAEDDFQIRYKSKSSPKMRCQRGKKIGS